ncbi:LppX_LprAFG lipoprotein [Dactylosporangium sp. CA-233914]|uniref:LppX_LprAFG lipoprotein n=1 Tax=Dactylosporangium sp. CA-233914 TaxID=3239934 RepID=UPI003D8E08E7
MSRTQSRSVLLVAALTAALVALVGCSGKSDDQKSSAPTAEANLPAADGLLKDSSTAMSGIKTAKFLITADGTIAGLALKRAEGVLTKEGNAQGTAQVEQGTTVDLAFTIVGQTMWLKGPTGDYQQLPLSLAATVYDPSAILDPERGIAKVLSTATEGKTEASESVGGKDTYRASAKFPGENLSKIVPGVTGTIPGRLWIAKDSKRLLKATFDLPASGEAKGGTVTVTFTEFDAAVTINPPK